MVVSGSGLGMLFTLRLVLVVCSVDNVYDGVTSRRSFLDFGFYLFCTVVVFLLKFCTVN